jgi:hypothetical protein
MSSRKMAIKSVELIPERRRKHEMFIMFHTMKDSTLTSKP